MKKELSAFSVLIEMISKEYKINREKEFGVILNFMRITKLKIKDLKKFNEITENKKLLIKELEALIKKA